MPSGHYATWLPQLAARYEKEKDYEFHWVTLDPSVRQEKKIWAWNQFFHVLPTWKRGRAATLFWADRLKIRRKLQQIRPNLVHGWGTENIWGWATLEYPKSRIFSVQGLLGLYGKLGRQSWRDRLMARIEAAVLRRAPVISTESVWAKERIYEQTGRTDIHVVEYGVPDCFFNVEPCPDLHDPYAVIVGTADYRKGIDLAVRIFSRAGLSKYKLRVVGGTSAFGDVWKTNSPQNVEWLGRKSQKDVMGLMARASCLLLPTRADTGPTVAKEARVIGIPILASPHGGHTQYIQPGQNGFLCPLDSVSAWEEALLKIFMKPEEALAMGKFMREEHRRLLRPDRTAEGFLSLYRQVLTASQHSGST
jgi:glycosyltransferase involved in cell wall biosynthesis